MLTYFLKCLVFLTIFKLAISDPIGQNCQVPEKVNNLKPVLVECLGITNCQWLWIYDFSSFVRTAQLQHQYDELTAIVNVMK